MSTATNITVGSRVINAFFDTEGAARQAVDDLVAAGIPQQHISRTGGATADAASSTSGEHGFWESLKDFFLPDDDRGSYAEGLRRGGHLVAVTADEANYTRVLTIMDRDGAIDMDEREAQWRQDGWRADSAPAAARTSTGLAGVENTLLSAGAATPVSVADNGALADRVYGSERLATRTDQAGDTNWRSDEAARAAALDGSVPATAQAGRIAVRDNSHGLSRIRSYSYDSAAGELNEAQPGSFSAATDASRIQEHMDVISADGQTIGKVDHLDGPDRIKLTKNNSPDGQHHIVPFTWIDHVDQHVHLNRTLADIKAQQ